MEESSWVRSLYLYLMCVLSIGLVALGSISAATGLVHTVAPDLGHRDVIDRVGIGVANVASNVVDLLNESQSGDSDSYCRDVTDNPDDFASCRSDGGLGGGGLDGDSMGAIQEGIGEVKSELRTQIRNNSIDRMIRGVLLILGGVLLFRIHGRRTELFADGLLPAKPVPAPGPPPDPQPIPIPPPPANVG